ncbi:hypothetical protein M7I_4101 [Glarea lozoyensis 74030]|uniref:Uncharacterized protein n=1 Tax=Glarea lozoyensis (strain ATCC 74030 / MF5533) TaxID=1104152 RepID=H0EN98_GLAL7|nr:hypothetical protein M7I_4101 [Glarea lozoyensis 74030]
MSVPQVMAYSGGSAASFVVYKYRYVFTPYLASLMKNPPSVICPAHKNIV